MRSWRDWSWADGNFWDSGVQPQIAAYTVLIAAAKEAGDAQTQTACEQILKQEVAMADWLREHLPQITTAFLQRSASPDLDAKR